MNYLGRERVVTVRRPPTSPEVGLGGGHAAKHGDDEPDRVVRHVGGKHLAGVGDADPAAAARVEVDVVNAGGRGHHDLQLGEPSHEISGHRRQSRHQHGPRLCCVALVGVGKHGERPSWRELGRAAGRITSASASGDGATIFSSTLGIVNWNWNWDSSAHLTSTR